MNQQYPVTIIIPFYGVKRYIETCAISLFEQDFKEIEYIFIDDASLDCSKEILQEVLERYPQRKPHTRILTNPQNLGLYQTRKRGVLEARGEYILHTDSDDWIESDMVSLLYQKAQETGAEITSCDYLLHRLSEKFSSGLTYYQDPMEQFSKVVTSLRYISVWNKLVKTDLYKKVYKTFPVHRYINLCEDSLLVIPSYHFAQKTAHVFKTLYHYNQDRPHSLSSSSQREHLIGQAVWTDSWIYQFLKTSAPKRFSEEFKRSTIYSNLWKSFLCGQESSPTQLSKFDINLFSLWTRSHPPIHHKLVHSFTLLGFPFLSRKLRELRNFLVQQGGKVTGSG